VVTYVPVIAANAEPRPSDDATYKFLFDFRCGRQDLIIEHVFCAYMVTRSEPQHYTTTTVVRENTPAQNIERVEMERVGTYIHMRSL